MSGRCADDQVRRAIVRKSALRCPFSEEAKRRRDERIAEIKAAQAAGRTGKRQPPLPRRVNSLQDVANLLVWLEWFNSQSASLSEFEQRKLMEIIPAARSLLRSYDTRLFLGGGGAFRASPDVLTAFIKINERIWE